MEEKKDTSIVDQALEHPIKYTIMLTKEVYRLNKKFFWEILALVVVLALLSMMPLLGIFVTIISSILLFSLLLFTGRVLYRSDTMDIFEEEIRSISISKLWKDHWESAFGAYLGWVVVGLGVLLLAFLTFAVTGDTNFLMTDTGSKNSTVLSLSVIFYMIIASLMFYVTPLVFANTIRTNAFDDAFKSVFTLFSGDVWRRAFTGIYFKYMTLIGLVLIVLVVGISVFFSIVFAITGSSEYSFIIGIPLTVITFLMVQVLFNIFYAIASVIADRMTLVDRKY